MSDTLDKVQTALSDPAAPWYGSDVVEWAGELCDEISDLRTRLAIAVEALEWVTSRMGCECDTYHGYRCEMCVIRAHATHALDAIQKGGE